MKVKSSTAPPTVSSPSDEDGASMDRPDGPADSADHYRADTAQTSSERAARSAIRLGAVMTVAMLAALGWLAYQNYTIQLIQDRQSAFVQAARQGALNLTTINWKNADADVDRIINGATGTFREEFSSRAEDFKSVVKQAESTSVGTVIDAGLESHTADAARALVAVSVQTTTSVEAAQPPRTWRMRVTMQREDDHQIKVADVEFVP